MKKGFTLLELIIVIIILGILATLGFAQYQRMVERARGAEARAVMGTIRTQLAARYMETENLTPYNNNTLVGIGTGADMIPSACRNTHYFSYTLNSTGTANFVATATRCTNGGKIPNATSSGTLILSSNFITGTDTWTGTGGY